MSVSQVDQLVASIRAAWVRREGAAARSGSSSRSKTTGHTKKEDAPATAALAALQQRLATIDRADPKAVDLALTAYVEAVLIREFENRRLTLDAGFADVVRRVAAVLREEIVGEHRP